MSVDVSLLYVGADEDTAAARAERLERDSDLSVTTAVGLADATEILAEADINCVISEFQLPDADGFEVLDSISSSHESLPVIFVTTNDQGSIIHDAFERGAADVFPESVIKASYEPLLDRVRDAVIETKREAEDAYSHEYFWGGFEPAVIVDEFPEPPTNSELDPASVVSDATEEDTSGITLSSERGQEAANPVESQPIDDDVDIDLSRLKQLPRNELLALLDLNDDPTAPPEADGQQSKQDSPDETEPSGVDPVMASATTETPVEEPTSTLKLTANQGDENVSATTYSRPSGLDLTPGTTILVECRSQNRRKFQAHRDLLGIDTEADRNVVLIRYRSMSVSRFEAIVRGAKRVKLITVGCSQRIPESIRETVEVIHIRNPNDVRRLGILSTGVVNEWDGLDSGVSVSLSPLDILFNYKSVEGVFRFLHIFLGKLSSQDALTQIHIDPSSTGSQKTNTIKPLFDHILTLET